MVNIFRRREKEKVNKYYKTEKNQQLRVKEEVCLTHWLLNIAKTNQTRDNFATI